MSFACAQCCFNKWLGMTRRTFFHFLPLSSKLRAWAEWALLQETTPALQRHRPWPELLPKTLNRWRKKAEFIGLPIAFIIAASLLLNRTALCFPGCKKTCQTTLWPAFESPAKGCKRSILERSWHHRKRKTKWPAPTTSATINVAVRKAELPPVFSFWGACKVPYELIPWHAVVLSTGSVAWVACVSCVLWSLNGSKCKHKRSINVKSSKLFKAVQIWIDSKRLKQSQILLNSPNLSKIVVICAGILAERLYC